MQTFFFLIENKIICYYYYYYYYENGEIIFYDLTKPDEKNNISRLNLQMTGHRGMYDYECL